MKRIVLKAASVLILFLSVFILFSLRLKDTVQLWKCYNIIYISNDYSENEVFDLCISNGVDGIISRCNSTYSVKNRMLPTLKPYSNEGFTSESMRDFFFSDQSDSYFLLYIPSESLEQASTVLNNRKIPFGIDASVTYPVLCPIICLLSFIILMMTGKMKPSKAFCLVPLIAVSIAVPFYSVAASISCLIFVFCISDLYSGRTGAGKVILKKIPVLVIFTAGIVSAVLSGLHAVIFIAAGSAISLLLLYIRNAIQKTYRNEAHFQPVFILSARWIKESKRYNLKTLLPMLIFSTCFLILTVFSDYLSTGIKTQDLLLPSPSGYTEETGFTVSGYAELSELHDSERSPDLSDFLNEKWYAETAAYRKVNESYHTAYAGEKIQLPSFRETDGRIVEKDITLFSFDDSYVSSAVDTFNNREGLEKLLVSEDVFFTTGYASTGKIEMSAYILPSTAICAVCFLILTVVYSIKRHIT